MARMTPHECIQEAILNNLPDVDDSMTKEQKLHLLSDAIVQFLDAEGYTLVDREAVWDFHDTLEAWLNQDTDGRRLGTFSPYHEWLAVYRHLPPRYRYDKHGQLIK